MLSLIHFLGQIVSFIKDRISKKIHHQISFILPIKKLKARRGFGTLEIVIIIAVLLTIALIFRKTLISYANNLISAVFDESIVNDMGNYQLED